MLTTLAISSNTTEYTCIFMYVYVLAGPEGLISGSAVEAHKYLITLIPRAFCRDADGSGGGGGGGSSFPLREKLSLSAPSSYHFQEQCRER